MTQEKFTIKRPDGKKIVGLINGLEKDKIKPVLVLLHGFKGFKEQSHIEYPAQKLSEHDFITLRFDSTDGLDESDGDIFNCTVSSYLEDLKTVIDYIKSLNEIDKNNIHLYGASLGALTVFLFASKNNQIKSLILHESPFYWDKENLSPDKEGWKQKGYQIFHSSTKNIDVKVSYNLYRDVLKFDNKKTIQEVKCPVLVITGKDGGDNIPMESTQDLFDNIKTEKKLELIQGARHSPREEKHLEKMTHIILNWLKDHS